MFNDMNSYALGAHVWFFREGDDFTLEAPGGTAAVDALPNEDDDGWISAGDIESFEDPAITDEEKEPRKPLPGALVRKDIITIFQAMEQKFVTNSLRRIAVELFYRTVTKLDEGQGQFVPLTAPPRKCWVKMQRYTQENDLVFAQDLWCQVKVTGGMKSGNGDIVMPEYTCKILDSDLNTMFFGDAALL